MRTARPVVYDSSSSGIQRQPFAVWMLDSVGPVGVKRLEAKHRGRIPGVLGFCREVFERQVPFDPEFRMDDTKFYCVELTEKAFRSQDLAFQSRYGLATGKTWSFFRSQHSPFFACRDWCWTNPSPLIKTSMFPATTETACGLLPCSRQSFPPRRSHQTGGPCARQAGGLSLRGDFAMVMFVVGESAAILFGIAGPMALRRGAGTMVSALPLGVQPSLPRPVPA